MSITVRIQALHDVFIQNWSILPNASHLAMRSFTRRIRGN